MITIGIDIDETLVPFNRYFRKMVNERLGLKLPPRTKTVYRLEEIYPEVSHEDIEACVIETHTSVQKKDCRPYPNAKKTIDSWKEKGYRIVLLTSRLEEFVDVTCSWLDIHKIYYDSIYFANYKIPTIIEQNINVMIDDRPDVIIDTLEKTTASVSALIHPWNRKLYNAFKKDNTDVKFLSPENQFIIFSSNWKEMGASIDSAIEYMEESKKWENLQKKNYLIH